MSSSLVQNVMGELQLVPPQGLRGGVGQGLERSEGAHGQEVPEEEDLRPRKGKAGCGGIE